MDITFANNNNNNYNGVLKEHVGVKDKAVYKQCMRNHAASRGGHVLDGCGEFMPAPTATASDPTSLKCMACGCHRNFHFLGAVQQDMHVVQYRPQNRHHSLLPPGSELIQAVAACDDPLLLALSSSGGDRATITTAAAAVDQHHQQQRQLLIPNSTRKRFRTKFSQEQKDKMHEFAERLEWRMVKSNEELINGFCKEIGVERGVFKVWMHNNKNTFGKKYESTTTNTTNYGVISANYHHQGAVSFKKEYNNNHNNNNGIIELDGNGVGNSHSSSISQE